MNSTPKISVILPVYNAEKYLAESIQSILNQSYTNFELIIINDGSVDASEEIIKSFNDQRIVYASQTNQGLAATLNRGITMAKANLIARQDNDDISLPNRLEQQVQFFEQNSWCILLGTAAQIIDENGHDTGRNHMHPIDPKKIKFALLFNNPFVHSSVMFKKEAAMACGLYDTRVKYFEDYNLWSKMARIGEPANLKESLLKYREVNTGMSKTTVDYDKRVINQSKENILYYCPHLKDSELNLFLNAVDDNNLLIDSKAQAHLRDYLFNELSTNFCRKEQVDQGFLKEEMKKVTVNFKRQYFNQIINSNQSSRLDKIKALMMRKILFIFNKRYL